MKRRLDKIQCASARSGEVGRVLLLIVELEIKLHAIDRAIKADYPGWVACFRTLRQ